MMWPAGRRLSGFLPPWKFDNRLNWRRGASMNHTWKIVSCATSLALPALWLGFQSGRAAAQQAPVYVNPVGASDGTAPGADTIESVPLGPSYEKLSEGLSFRPPADCRMVEQANQDFL